MLDAHLKNYPCPSDCPAHIRMLELFGVASEDIDNDVRVGAKKVALANQLVDGFEMRKLIATMLLRVGEGISNGNVAKYTNVSAELAKSPARTMGYILGAISDLCFNMEYVRRITDARWSYCNEASSPRVYYPYLGVCPHCVLKLAKPTDAALGPKVGVSDEERVNRARYFGNKIESHHVGRIGERVIVYLLDVLTKSCRPNAKSLIIFDDQHDVDAAFFFDGVGILAQIKASPLILLPVVAKLHMEMTEGVDEATSLPRKKKSHLAFTGFPSAEHELHFYFSIDDSTLSLGHRGGAHWPYRPLIDQLTEENVFKIIENWFSIYLAFAVPKRGREGDNIKLAYLTSGWGAPIDDNKAKAGLARSDNMMKGTYASLKYGAYYVQECARGTLKTALVANIDPVHQYADYLEKLEDIRWGHEKDFSPSQTPDGKDAYTIAASNLTNLFDSVFTFNRQIVNDKTLGDVWNLDLFYSKLKSSQLVEFVSKWGNL